MISSGTSKPPKNFGVIKRPNTRTYKCPNQMYPGQMGNGKYQNTPSTALDYWNTPPLSLEYQNTISQKKQYENII